MSQETSQAEKSASSAKNTEQLRLARAKRGPRRPPQRPDGWVPFGNAPKGIQRRYRKLLDDAHRRPMAAMKLFCIECMGYSATEPKLCEALACPLYAYNRRMFGGEK